MIPGAGVSLRGPDDGRVAGEGGDLRGALLPRGGPHALQQQGHRGHWLRRAQNFGLPARAHEAP